MIDGDPRQLECRHDHSGVVAKLLSSEVMIIIIYNDDLENAQAVTRGSWQERNDFENLEHCTIGIIPF